MTFTPARGADRGPSVSGPLAKYLSYSCLPTRDLTVEGLDLGDQRRTLAR